MKYIIPMITGSAAFLFIYLLGSFGNASFDIREWLDYGRGLISMLGGGAFALAAYSTYVKMEDAEYEGGEK